MALSNGNWFLNLAESLINEKEQKKTSGYFGPLSRGFWDCFSHKEDWFITPKNVTLENNEKFKTFKDNCFSGNAWQSLLYFSGYTPVIFSDNTGYTILNNLIGLGRWFKNFIINLIRLLIEAPIRMIEYGIKEFYLSTSKITNNLINSDKIPFLAARVFSGILFIPLILILGIVYTAAKGISSTVKAITRPINTVKRFVSTITNFFSTKDLRDSEISRPSDCSEASDRTSLTVQPIRIPYINRSISFNATNSNEEQTWKMYFLNLSLKISDCSSLSNFNFLASFQKPTFTFVWSKSSMITIASNRYAILPASNQLNGDPLHIDINQNTIKKGFVA